MARDTRVLSVEEKRRKREEEKAARKTKREARFAELSKGTLLEALSKKTKKKTTAAGRRGVK